jgi:FkbM family methyltransferase
MRSDLIIDVGMHDGTDTSFYLAKGFSVVAIEANPDLVAAARQRFAQELDQGRLTIVAAAITETGGTTSIAIADEMTIWSSLDTAFINRNQGVKYRYVDVPAVTFASVIAEYGVPYFLKVDIEGLDMLPIRALREVQERPRYVSIESNVTSNDAAFDRVFEELAELWSLGYRAFKYVNQRLLPRVRLPDPPGEGQYVDARFTGHSSGPFGRETPGRWLSAQQALAQAELLRLKHNIGGYGGRWRATRAGSAYASARNLLLRRENSWYDLHARLGD